MKLNYYLLIIISLLFQSVRAQEYHYYTYEIIRDTVRDTIKVHDTITIQPKLDSILSKFDLSFNDFMHTFQQYIEKKGKSIYPLEEDIYLNYLLPLYLEKNMNKRYFMKMYFENKQYGTIDFTNLHTPMHSDLAHDVMLVIEGEINTDNFIKSPSNQKNTLYKVLNDIIAIKKDSLNKNDRKIGLNIYFPDFSFKEKRAMAQFVKSVSLVIDSINIPEIRNIPLYFTFNKNVKEDNSAFLVGLCDMADSVFVVNTPSLMNFEAIDKNAEISKFEKIKNQFYFVRFYMDDFPTIDGDLSCDNLELLMNADYPNTWEGYLLGIIGIIVLLIIGTVCYFLITPFANFIHEHYMYVFAGVIILITEIILLFVFMIEEMNSHTKVFNLWEILIVLILLVIIIPVIKKGIKNAETP